MNRVEAISDKLDEIYEWFTVNLKGQQLATSAIDYPNGHHEPPGRDRQRLTFSVWLEPASNPVRTVCCPQASFSDGWLDIDGVLGQRKRIFQCHCGHTCQVRGGPCSKPQVHQQALNFFCEIYGLKLWSVVR